MKPVMPQSGCFKFTDADLVDVRSILGGTPVEVSFERPPPEFYERLDAIQKEIGCHINGEYLVHYCLNDEDQNGLPVNNLRDKAISGKVIFDQGDNRCVNDRERFIGKHFTDPTWLDVTIAANDFLNVTDSRRHVYLEDILVVSESNNTKHVTFVFGS